jgi:hypothetical protein
MRIHRTGPREGYGRYVIFVILLAAAAAALPRAASAGEPPPDPWPAGWQSDYMWRASNCTDQADPINLMFYGAGYRALSRVEQDLGWTDDEGDVMYVRDNGQCFPSNQRHGFSQRKSVVSNGENYHIRLWDGWGAVMSPWEYYTGAGVHTDKEVTCFPNPFPHKAVDFDGPRNEILGAFASHGYTVGYLWRNNQQPSPQHCSGVDPDPHSNGWVGTIQLPIPSPTMFKDPAVNNLWICTNPVLCQGYGEHHLELLEMVRDVTTFDWNHGDQFDGVGRYQYDVTFDSTVVNVASFDLTLLGSTGRSVTCGSSSISGGKQFWCQSQGSASQPGPLTKPNGSSGELATDRIDPNLSLVDPTSNNFRIRPTKNNYLQTAVNDANCILNDISGNAVPGSSTNGLLPYCYGASVKVRVLEGDLNLDCRVNILDEAALSFRYGASFSLFLYSVWYDLEPRHPMDWDIDIKDLQFAFGRDGSTCQNPIPPQPP